MPAIAERLPAKYLIKDEAPKTISSPQQHVAYISRLLELQRKAHRTAEETETAKLLIVLFDGEMLRFVVRDQNDQQLGSFRFLCRSMCFALQLQKPGDICFVLLA